MAHIGWTDDRVDHLRTLWQDGLSAAQIAKALGGVTRNAVIGKVHRLGLAGRAAPSAPRAIGVRRPKAPRPARAAARRSLAPLSRPAPQPALRLGPARSPVAAPEGPGLVTSMTALGVHLCKWPIGDPKADDFSFCGRIAAGERPYCEGHLAAAHRPASPPPLAQDPLIRRVLAGRAA